MLELLIAMALLAVVAVGILPLLMRSLADRNRGWEATSASSFAQSQIEPLLAAPFNSVSLDLSGTLTETVAIGSWNEGDPDKVGDRLEGWTDTPQSTRGKNFWTRNTYIRWFSTQSLETALHGDADPGEVDLKEIRVQIVSERRGGALGGGQELWIRVLKAY